ncbi:nascent polypeptide-associated complex subunit alpha, muscle-specific form, partial [Austrofundulus limnaeus]|uniref:Nascent polypeptide-associated complex subunit alpha, muscle-specific form n=1 Tax=Austrofundulus limnaeus TaxID=52670 RepID=A0A2I4AL84_AUSLI
VPSSPEDVPSSPEDVPSSPEDVPSSPEDVPSSPEDVTFSPEDIPSSPQDAPQLQAEDPSIPAMRETAELPQQPPEAPKKKKEKRKHLVKTPSQPPTKEQASRVPQVPSTEYKKKAEKRKQTPSTTLDQPSKTPVSTTSTPHKKFKIKHFVKISPAKMEPQVTPAVKHPTKIHTLSQEEEEKTSEKQQGRFPRHVLKFMKQYKTYLLAGCPNRKLKENNLAKIARVRTFVQYMGLGSQGLGNWLFLNNPEKIL